MSVVMQENVYGWTNAGRLAFTGFDLRKTTQSDEVFPFHGVVIVQGNATPVSWTIDGTEYVGSNNGHVIAKLIGPEHPGYTHLAQKPKTRKLVPWKLSSEHWGKRVRHKTDNIGGVITGHEVKVFHVGFGEYWPKTLLERWEQLDGSPCGDWVEE